MNEPAMSGGAAMGGVAPAEEDAGAGGAPDLKGAIQQLQQSIGQISEQVEAVAEAAGMPANTEENGPENAADQVPEATGAAPGVNSSLAAFMKKPKPAM